MYKVPWCGWKRVVAFAAIVVPPPPLPQNWSILDEKGSWWVGLVCPPLCWGVPALPPLPLLSLGRWLGCLVAEKRPKGPKGTKPFNGSSFTRESSFFLLLLAAFSLERREGEGSFVFSMLVLIYRVVSNSICCFFKGNRLFSKEKGCFQRTFLLKFGNELGM